tara:strand:- start:4378 stop:4707 length:330 start_codon:yes stop_codon:yes gene_type:complete
MMKEETIADLANHLIEELTSSLDLIAASIKELAVAQDKTAQAIFHMAREDGPIEFVGGEIRKSGDLIATAIGRADYYDGCLGDDIEAGLIKAANVLKNSDNEAASPQEE